MNTCACGNEIEAKSVRCARCAALQVLGLEAGASDEEIKAEYRTLVKVWHPDRFEDDRKLKASAENKLKGINTAFQFLASPSSMKARPNRAKDTAPAAHNQEPGKRSDASQRQTSPATETTRSKASTSRQAPPRPHDNPQSPPPQPGQQQPQAWPNPQPVHPYPTQHPGTSPSSALKEFLRWAAFACAIAFGRYFWHTVETTPHNNTDAAKTYESQRAKGFQIVESPQQNQAEAIAQPLRVPGQRKTANRTPHPGGEIAKPAISQEQDKFLQQETSTSTTKELTYITVGSAKADVLKIQGTPSAFSDNKLEYNGSEVYLRNNKVVGWRNYPALSPLRVMLLPETHVHPRAAYFSVGSTKDEVLAIQGTPTAFSDNTFEYSGSEVYFRNNRVISWRNYPALSRLRVRLLPETPVDPSLAYFSVGSTKDEVLTIQGTPTSFSANTFEYSGSEVYFRDNKVVSWRNYPALSPLRVKLQ